jgi:hypothetical protein
VPEGDQDHGRIPVPVAIGLGSPDQGLDFAGGEVRTCPDALPQGIIPKQETTLDVVDRSRIRAASLRKGEFFHAPSMQQPREVWVA